MLAFAAPTALIALAALAVPIALHLWSRLTGRPLRVGSVAFFAAAPPPVARRPQIEDPWLLVLRCGTLAALALALAQPYWRSSSPARSDAVWALVASEADGTPLVDSLRASGAHVHVLEKGPIWSLLREADYAAPPGTRFVVVAPNRGALGERPGLRAETHWLVPTFLPHPLSPSPETGEGGRGGRLRSVTVYSDDGRREDARYVTAALRAAAQVTGQPAVVTQRDVASLGGDADWIVWLAAQPVPGALIEQARRGATLLSDAPTDTAGPGAGAPIWSDGAGHATLTLNREGSGHHFAFHGRFHPHDGNFVLSPAFPQAMAALWAGAPNPVNGPVAISQLIPARDSTHQSSSPARHDLYHVFWLAAVALFLIERVVSRRARETTA